MGPEVMLKIGYGYKADIWSLGVTICEIIGGCIPFTNYHPKLITSSLNLPKNIDPLMKNLLKQMLVTNPHDRPNITQIKNHPCFSHVNWPKVENMMLIPPNVPEKLHVSTKIDESKQLKSQIEKNGPRRSSNFLGDFMMKRINNELKNF